MISIALTKGRIEKELVKVLEKSNFSVDELKDKGRKLVFNDNLNDIRYFLVKANDTVTYVEHGVADIAVVGKDTLLEREGDYYELLDLKIGKCKFIVATLPNIDIFKKIGHIKIGTKYPKVAKRYFERKGMDVEIIKIDGSVELSPILGISEGIVDIMETGITLKENGLIVVDEICDISTRVIVNKSSFKLKKKEINNNNINEIIKNLKERSNTINIRKSVEEIIENIKLHGNKALREYTLKFDNVELKDFLISNEEIEEAYKQCDKTMIRILEECKNNITKYHEKQKETGYIYQKELGIYMGQRIIPVDSVGVYVPGGKAAYPSSVLMNIIPAQVAGVQDIIIATPPNYNNKVNSNILVAARVCGINKIYKIGGAQAIAALAYGTESIEPVSMIVGPGNSYVAEAKSQVYGVVGIDMVAGPSEILIIAKEGANPRYIAADMMSQAEHDEAASSILLTTSKRLALEVEKEINIQLKSLSRKEIIEKSLNDYGKIIICNNLDECIKLSNLISPEHLELLIENPMEYLGEIKNAGSVFLGEYTPEPIGDYFGGTNHVLPTGGTAKFSSPLSVDTFLKKSSFLFYSKKALYEDGKKVIRFANEEGLTAHANSIRVRLENEKN